MITTGTEPVEDGTATQSFDAVTVFIKKRGKAKWTMIVGFGGATVDGGSMGATGSFLTMALIFAVTPERGRSAIRAVNNRSSDVEFVTNANDSTLAPDAR